MPMKRILLPLSLFVVLACSAIAATIAVLSQSTVINTSTTAPIQVTNASIGASSVTLIGMKGPQTTNTTTVWVGYGLSVNGQQGIPVNPGQIVTLQLDPGAAFFSLSNIWFDVTTANDGLTVIYD